MLRYVEIFSVAISDRLLMEEILHHLRYIKPCKRWVYSPYQLVSRISSINSIYMIYTYMIYTYILYTYIHIYIYPHRCWAPSNNLRTSKGLWSSYFRSDSRLSGPWRICIIFDRCTIVWCALMCMLQFKRVCFWVCFCLPFQWWSFCVLKEPQFQLAQQRFYIQVTVNRL